MNPIEQKQLLADILQAAQAGDTAVVSEKITALSEDYGAVSAELTLAKGKVDELAGKNAALQDQNLKLFLKQGAVVIPATPDPEPDKPARFEDLFDPVTGRLK